MKTIIFLSLLLISSTLAVDIKSQKEYNILLSNFAYQAKGDQVLLEGVQSFMSSYFGASQTAEESSSESNSLLCSGCKIFFNLLQQIDQPLLKIVEKLMVDTAVNQCLTSYKFTEDVCRQYSLEMTPFIVESIQQHFFDPDYACPFIKVCPKVYEPVDIDALVLGIVSEKPQLPIQNEKPKSGKTLKVLQIADIHVDLGYLEGYPTTCNYPICCRNNNFTLNSTERLLQSSQLSGYWGTLGNCDLPLRTFDQFVQFVKRNLSDSIDLVVWTGDNVGHDEENSELNRNFNITKLITERLQENLNLTIVGSYGNNDAAPDYIYDFEGNLDTKLQRDTAEIWKQWIDENAQLTLSQHGYFATRIPHLPNLKVISLNTFACTEKNYMLLRDSTDPGKQLQWLNDELLESEQKGESVYIQGHIPNNYCAENWGKVYKALAERFQSTIKAQLFGHTHSDYYTLQKSALNANETIGVQFITPSLTPNYNKNPSFRVYTVDADTYEILDFDQYRLNLNKYNQLGATAETLEWDLIYNFKQNYNLTDVSLETLNNLVQNLSSKNSIYDQLNQNYLTLYSPPSGFSKNLYCLSTESLTEGMSACNGGEPYPGMEQKVFHAIEKTWRRKIHN